MIRTIEKRSRGRPTGWPPLFVEDCVRGDATGLLAKSRGYRGEDDASVVQWRFEWTDCGRRRARTVPLCVLTTPQPLGGVRRWWRCPTCGRRCGVLLAAKPESSIACRRCLRAQYAADYPGRNRFKRLAEMFRSMASGSLDEKSDRELKALLAKRRRGVRRGRRVRRRADRLAAKAGDIGFWFVDTWGSTGDKARMATERARTDAVLDLIRTLEAQLHANAQEP